MRVRELTLSFAYPLQLELKELPKARLREILTRKHPERMRPIMPSCVSRARCGAVSIGMEGVNDATLAALAEDIARDDAASAAVRSSPRRSKAAADAGGDAAEGGAEGEEEEDDDDVGVELAQGPPGARHQRGRSSSTMLNMLLDLDLGLPPADGDEADEWVRVVPPMAGGTRGVAGVAGAALPPATAAAGNAMARPSLRMLAAQPPGAGEEPDLTSLSPTASASADAA